MCWVKQLEHKYNMNYLTIYQNLISIAKHREHVIGYSEKHHIIPRCLGGTNDSENLVKLTAREHFIAHLLLAKIHGGTLWHAVKLMASVHRYNSRLYEVARRKHSEFLSIQNKKNKTKPKAYRTYQCSYCHESVVKLEFCHHLPKEHYYCNAACRNLFVAASRPSRKGIPLDAAKGRVAWNKGTPNPDAAQNARKGALKLSKISKGRKRHYKEDGSWTWIYPKE